jgi:hypothetical protein
MVLSFLGSDSIIPASSCTVGQFSAYRRVTRSTMSSSRLEIHFLNKSPPKQYIWKTQPSSASQPLNVSLSSPWLSSAITPTSASYRYYRRARVRSSLSSAARSFVLISSCSSETPTLRYPYLFLILDLTIRLILAPPSVPRIMGAAKPCAIKSRSLDFLPSARCSE